MFKVVITIFALVFIAGCGDLGVQVDDVDVDAGVSQPYCFESVEAIEEYCGIQDAGTIESEE